MRSCASPTQRPLFLITIQIGLVLLLEIRWFLIFTSLESLSQSVYDFENLFTLSVTLIRSTSLDILVPFSVSEDYLTIHSLLEILPRFAARLKFLIVLLKVSIIETRRTLFFLIPLRLFCTRFQFVFKQCLFLPRLQRSAHLERNLACYVSD